MIRLEDRACRRITGLGTGGKLFGTSSQAITRTIQDTQPLLDQHSCTVPRSTARFTTPTDVAAYLDSYDTEPPDNIKHAC